jgi:hypothetical protein
MASVESILRAQAMAWSRKMAAASEPLKRSDISRCDAAHQRTRRKARRAINVAQKSCNAPLGSYAALKTKHISRC